VVLANVSANIRAGLGACTALGTVDIRVIPKPGKGLAPRRGVPPVRDNQGVLARFAVGAGGVVLGLVSLAIARLVVGFSFAGASVVGAVAFLAAGWSILAGALAFGARRVAHRVVPLLVAAAFGWFLAEWDTTGAGSSVVFTVGLLVTGAVAPLIGWVVLSFPTGRLSDGVDRAAVIFAATGAVLIGPGVTVVFNPQAAGCVSCPDNLLYLAGGPAAAVRVGQIGLILGAVSSLLLIGVAVWRIARSSRPRRRVLAPVAGAGIAYLAAVAYGYLLGIDRGFVGSGSVEQRLWLIQAGVLVALGAAVGWTTVRSRRTRSRLSIIVVNLDERSVGADLATGLAHSLGDPDLQIAYPVTHGRHVDFAGSPVVMPPDDGRSATAIVREETTVGVILHRPGLFDDPDLVEEVASAARLALEHERLQADLLVQEQELKASRARIVGSGDAERRRIERDLHDGAQQRLIALLLGLRMARTRPGIQQADDGRVVDVENLVEQSIAELRSVANWVHPAVLTDEGLAAAIEALAESSPEVSVECLPGERFPTGVENAAYHVVAETLDTGATHIAAHSRDGKLIVEVDAAEAPRRLVELQDRVGAIDGSLRVTASPGGSVSIRAEIPCV
jgi:signal transduction histidine kinase